MTHEEEIEFSEANMTTAIRARFDRIMDQMGGSLGYLRYPGDLSTWKSIGDGAFFTKEVLGQELVAAHAPPAIGRSTRQYVVLLPEERISMARVGWEIAERKLPGKGRHSGKVRHAGSALDEALYLDVATDEEGGMDLDDDEDIAF